MDCKKVKVDLERLGVEPLFKKILLKIPKQKQEENSFATFFDENKSKEQHVAFFLDCSADCDHKIFDIPYGGEVFWNQNVSLVIEEDEDFQYVLTHETNLLGYKK